jgi:hypothetical protein
VDFARRPLSAQTSATALPPPEQDVGFTDRSHNLHAEVLIAVRAGQAGISTIVARRLTVWAAGEAAR